LVGLVGQGIFWELQYLSTSRTAIISLNTHLTVALFLILIVALFLTLIVALLLILIVALLLILIVALLLILIVVFLLILIVALSMPDTIASSAPSSHAESPPSLTTALSAFSKLSRSLAVFEQTFDISHLLSNVDIDDLPHMELDGKRYLREGKYGDSINNIENTARRLLS
jgi:hypothetical protein